MAINKMEFDKLEMQIEKIESLSVALSEAIYGGNLECDVYEPAFILLNDLLYNFRIKINELSDEAYRQDKEVEKWTKRAYITLTTQCDS